MYMSFADTDLPLPNESEIVPLFSQLHEEATSALAQLTSTGDATISLRSASLF